MTTLRSGGRATRAGGRPAPAATDGVLRLVPGALSVTVELRAVPLPADRLSDLVVRAVLALEAELVAPGPGPTGQVGLVQELGLDLVDGAGTVLLSGPRGGPFPRAALQGTVEGAAAREALAAVTGGPQGLLLRSRVRLPAPVAAPCRVRVALGRLHRGLSAAADPSRVFRETDLLGYLPRWQVLGAVEVLEAGVEPARVLAAVLKAARPLLTPAEAPDDGLGPAYVLSASPPPETDVVVGAPASGASTVERVVEAPLGALAQQVTGGGADQVLHVVTPVRGRLELLLPAQRAVGTRAPVDRLTAVHVLQGDRLVGLSAALHPGRPAHLLRPPTHAFTDLELVLPEEQRPGPVLGDAQADAWPDRYDDQLAWYAPTFVLDLPRPDQPVDAGPFLFDVVPDGGHGVDGAPGIVATIRLRLRAVPPPGSEAAAGGRAVLRAVDLAPPTAHLAVPFRDEHGATLVERVAADSVTVEGDLGAGGALLVVVRLADGWARLAYGALSQPGFQAQGAQLDVELSFAGWRRARRWPVALGLHKRWQLPDELALPRRRSGGRARPAAPFMAATVLPHWSHRPDRFDHLLAEQHVWSTFARTVPVPALVPCGEHGTAYREQVDGGWRAIGCRPSMQLGQIEHRTYEPVEVAAATGWARVHRSLARPGRFLVVPDRYLVGRAPQGAGERAYRPMLLLHSTLDPDAPSMLRCVLAASLEPDVPPYVRSAVLAELRALHPEPVLEWPPETGHAPQVDWAVPTGVEVDTVPSADGFDVVLSSDLTGFLALRALLERDGLRGSAGLVLPGGVRPTSSLVLGTGAVTGPFATGALDLGPDRAGRTVVRNRTGQRIALLGLAVDGVQAVTLSEVLEPSGEVRVEGGGARPDAVYAADSGAERLDEVRAYVEDLTLGLVLVAAGALGGAGEPTGLEVRTRFLGHADPDPLVLTADGREQRRSFVVPLTAFAAAEQPVVDLQVVVVGADGARQEGAWTPWPLRERGALVTVRATEAGGTVG